MTAPSLSGDAAAPPSPGPASRRRRSPTAWTPLLLVAALAIVPVFQPGPNTVRMLFGTLIWVTVSVAWNLIGGFGGQVSFGFAVFYGLGAYAAALLMSADVSPLWAFLIAGGVAALASLLIGLPTFRLKGPYFAIATIGVSEAVRVAMTNFSLTGGASGYRLVEKGAFRQQDHYFGALVLAVVAVAVSLLVRRSRLGLALVAVREDEDAAADLGVNPFRTKLLAHAIAAALTGAAGGVHARYVAYINPQSEFAFAVSVAVLIMPIIGGVGTIWGPVVGAAVYGLVRDQITASFPELHLLIYGGMLILIVLFEPAGLLGLAGRAWRRFGRRRGEAATRG